MQTFRSLMRRRRTDCCSTESCFKDTVPGFQFGIWNIFHRRRSTTRLGYLLHQQILIQGNGWDSRICEHWKLIRYSFADIPCISRNLEIARVTVRVNQPFSAQAAQVVGWALGQSVMPSTWQVGGNVTLVIGVPMTWYWSSHIGPRKIQ